MAGTAVTPAPVAGKAMNGGIGAINNNNNNNDNNNNTALTASYVNHFRISACADRLAIHIRAAPKNDPVEFFNLCLSLARGIDYAIANKEVPSRAQELPLLLKQVCHMRNDSFLQAAILVLMISVKNACESRWFSDQDSKELCSLANEILSSFCSTMNFNTEPNTFLSIISTIMSRFYPRMKMGEMLAFLEVKPGYGTYVHDFQISKDMKSTPEEKIRLFVAHMDNIETSSCLITPTLANFLLNGKGVERRNNVFMDPGPQMPTPVYNLLKYGTNLLQAVGQFNGRYIIVIAFMSMISTPDHSALEDYVQPTLSMVDSDSEVIEGPSRISLNCPISFRRIKVPAKGHMCKHLQCFDYENYMEINSRRPSWRCPHCNQYVCFTDIRIDQNMVKVLKEVGENVNNVIISSDGSWKAIMESDDLDDKPQDKTTISGQDETAQPESSGFANAPADVLDLTADDYEMDTFNICETEDRKRSSTICKSQSDIQNMTVDSHINSTNERNQNTATHIEDNFWSGIYLSTYGSEASSSRSECQIGGVTEPTHRNLLSPILTDANSALNQDAVPFHGSALVATSVPQSEISMNSLPLQQFQFGNTTVTDDYGRFPLIPRHVSRMPIAVQALPAQTPTTLHERLVNNMHTIIQSGPSIASLDSAISLVPDGLSSVPSNMERLQQFSRTHSFPLQGSGVASSTLQQYQGTQTVGLHSPSQMQSSYRVSSVFPTENTSQQPMLNVRAGLNPSPGLTRPSASFSRTHNHQGSSQTVIGQATGIVGSQQARAVAVAQQAAQMARAVQTSRSVSPYPVNMEELRSSMGVPRETVGGTAPPVTRTDISMDLQTEQNWRPTGRMRGSLSGRAYSDALNQFIMQPTQQAQATRPVSSSTSLSASAQYELLMANRAALAQAGSCPYTGSASTSGGSGVLPERRG